MFGLEGRTADGPPLGCGQSAGVLKKSSREVVSLVGFKSDGRTVRGSVEKLSRDAVSLSVRSV